jgi:hypothetical protein
MSQNTSAAVMQQRKEARDSLDDFPTPPWSTRALMEHIIIPEVYGGVLPVLNAWEPACNRGFMAKPLKEYFPTVFCSDVHDYGYDGMNAVHDFLFPTLPELLVPERVDWIITNPPFRLAEQFIHRALRIARKGVAIIQRTAFAEGDERYESLFKNRRPAIVAQHVERVPMQKGTCFHTNQTATAYAWYVWLSQHDMADTRFRWIPKCRAQLERPGDYMEPPQEDAPAPLFDRFGEICT